VQRGALHARTAAALVGERVDPKRSAQRFDLRRSLRARRCGDLHAATVGDEDEVREFLDARLEFKASKDELPDLVTAAPREVQDWMQREARLADETRGSVCGALALRRAFAEHLGARGAWIVADDDMTWRGAQVALLGMLHDLCKRSWQALTRSEEISVARARRLGVTHRRLLSVDTECAERRGRIEQRALGRSVGVRR
jgi:hypothetical protein